MIKSGKPKFFYGYTIVTLGFIVVMAVEGLIFYSFGVFFPPLLAAFGWTRAMTSAAVSLRSIVRIPTVIVVGRLTDRFGPRLVLTWCGCFLGLGYILMSQVNALWHLYVFYGVIVALGSSFYWIPVVSMVPRWFAKRRGMMMGIVTSGIGIGQVIGPPLVNRLISTYGWRTSFVIVGSMVAAVVVVAAQFLKSSPQKLGLLPYGVSEAKQEDSETKTRGLHVRQLIVKKQFWAHGMIYLFWILPLSVVSVHIIIHGIGIGMTAAEAANIIAVVGITSIVGRLGFGRLADVIGNKMVLAISFILITAGFLWLLVAEEGWMIYLFAAVFGVSYGVFEILQSPMVADLFGQNSLGSVLGFLNVFSAIGILVGPVLAGHIFDITNSYNQAFMICAGLSVIAFILAILLKPVAE